MPAEGQVLLRTVFLSLDPYMRGRMSDVPTYAEPVQIGEVMVGGTVNLVVESRLEGFAGMMKGKNFGKRVVRVGSDD